MSRQSDFCCFRFSRMLTGVRRTLKLPVAAAWSVTVLGVAAALPTFGVQPVLAQTPERVGEIVEQKVYEELGASADGRAYVIVMLQPAQAGQAGGQRRRTAVKEIQDRVLSNLAPGEFRLVYRYENFAGMTGRVDAPGLAKLAADPNVAAVGPDARGHATLDVSVPFINADDVHALGYTGAGITVAVLDTGIDSDHPDLSDNIATGWYHFLDGGADVGAGAEDDSGHGTHVSGIITSNGANAPLGVAPDADILAIKVLKSDGSGWASDWVAGVDYVVSHKNDYDKLCSINMSLSTDDLFPQCPCDNVYAWTQAAQASLQAAKNAGIAVFASSGNDASTTSMGLPACLSAATAVGAVYDSNYGGVAWLSCTDSSSAPDQIVCLTNRSGCNELAAPGAFINSSMMGGGTASWGGTSMACPHVAGLAALMCQKCVDNGRLLTPNGMVQSMKSTGVPTNDPASTVPNPIRIDALYAVNDMCEKPATSVVKWEQLPDEDGWDVMAMDRCLADDWACTRSGEVTDIHFWGSWHGGVEDTFYGL